MNLLDFIYFNEKKAIYLNFKKKNLKFLTKKNKKNNL